MRTQIIAAVAAAFTAAISSAALANDAGVVESVAESAFGTAPGQTKTEMHAGDPVVHRQLLETSNVGGMKLKLADGSKLDIGADSKLLIVAYVYAPEQSIGNAVLSVPSGSVHYVTGAMPKGHTTIYTPTATMVLNGTDVTVDVNERGNTHVAVDEGSITVRSRTSGQEMVFRAGQSVDITPAGVATGTAEMTN